MPASDADKEILPTPPTTPAGYASHPAGVIFGPSVQDSLRRIRGTIAPSVKARAAMKIRKASHSP